MKKLVILLTILILIIGMITMTGCMKRESWQEKTGDIIGDEQMVADQLAEDIVELLDTGDKEGLKGMFSKKAKQDIKDLDTQIDRLFDHYEGQYVASLTGDAMVNAATQHGKDTKKLFQGQYELSTDENIYHFFYDIHLANEEDPETVGLNGLEFVTDDIYQQGVDMHGSYQWQFVDKGNGIYLRY